MNKIIGVVLLAVVLFFVVVIFRGCEHLPNTQNRLKAAEFIDDGELHPEMDGELVIVGGTLTAEKTAYDDELMITLPSPCAVRYVEMLTYSHDEDGYECLKWQPIRSSNKQEWLRERKLADGLKLGAYTLDPEFVRMLAPGKEVSRSMLNADEVNTLSTHNIHPIVSGGVFYLSEAPSTCFKSEVYDFSYESFRRVHYRILDPNKDAKYAIVGIADGDTLRYDDTLDTRPVFEDTVKKSDVVSSNLLYTVLGMIVVAIICIALLAYGASMFL